MIVHSTCLAVDWSNVGVSLPQAANGSLC
jgi:hypothetical protein